MREDLRRYDRTMCEELKMQINLFYKSSIERHFFCFSPCGLKMHLLHPEGLVDLSLENTMVFNDFKNKDHCFCNLTS